MSEGRRAREIIDSYPPTNENYFKAIESLKSRFGRVELLIEYYVLESCILEDIFRVWLRNPIVIPNGDSSKNVYRREIKKIIFFKTEIEGEERIRLAKTDFAPKVRYNERKEKISRSYATATDLFSGGVEKMKKMDNCIFCDKRHESKECYHAKKLGFEQKQEILKNKRCCFTCLKFGHQSKVCKSNVQCLLCNKRHWALMCPELPSNKMRVKTPDLEEKRDAGGKTRRVRALIDIGSQRSYLLKTTAHEMNLKPIEMKNIIPSVFGGSTLQKQDHRVYEITLQNVNRGFSFDIQVLDQPIICGKIPRINKGI
ncbi:DUF1758 domain-containing protein [Trichonephila clavipes]|nr:DUF1758 domain-containing protein [Trichonephila clavipes]